MALLTGWGISSGLTGVLLSAQSVATQTIDIVGIIPQWALVGSWGLSTIAVFAGGMASAYKRVAEGRARIIEAERDACTYPDSCKHDGWHKQRLCD